MDTEISQEKYEEILFSIPCAALNYEDWVHVSMAAKSAGIDFSVWNKWCATDPARYKVRDCERKWDSFKGDGITGATLTQFARDYGHDPFPKGESKELDWSDEITSDGIEEKPAIPTAYSHAQKDYLQIIEYLESVFSLEDHVNIITQTIKSDDGKLRPYGIGVTALTVDGISKQLRKYADEPDFFDFVFGSYDKEAGVWVRINAIDGKIGPDQKAISDKNVVKYENALIECDELSISEQIAKIKELKLPYKALVHSGKKSVHAIVRVDAVSLADYKERVKWLQRYCIEHGLPVDEANKNPSRMSRLPGVERNGQKQILLETAKPVSFDEWKADAIAAEEASNLEVVSFADIFNDLPELAPELIEGILREGHKMLISGPSKAGKSFALTALAIAIAEGREWFGFRCKQGKVLYLNLEIDVRSFYHRIADVYSALEYEPSHTNNIDVLNLRGKAEPIDKLGPKLEHKIRDAGYSLIIVDPIYKIITGDENSAADMGAFCNWFDRLAEAGNCAVAFCHHHSKGTQGAKSAIDRSSGSGVFGRDPDAIVDITPINIGLADLEEYRAIYKEYAVDAFLHETGQWQNKEAMRSEELHDRVAKEQLAEMYFDRHKDADRAHFDAMLERADRIATSPAYRVSMTLREFKSPKPVNLLFTYPIHIKDQTGYLERLALQGDNSIEALQQAKKNKDKERSDNYRAMLEKHFESNEKIRVGELAKMLDMTTMGVKGWVKKQEWLEKDKDGYVFPKKN
jgi:hypothetical protein